MSVGALAESDLTAKAIGNTEFKIKAGESATLEVGAASSGDISYQWYVEKITPYDKLEGETSNKLSTGKSGRYKCNVQDSLNGSVYVYFDVAVDNEFIINAAENQRFDYDANEDIVLKVEASCNKGTLHYEWYKASDIQPEYIGSYVHYEGISGSESALTVKRNRSYYCKVSDDYGNTKNVYFYVNTNTTVVPDGDTELTVERGSSVTLKVKATSPNNHFSFVWRTGLINNPPTESTDETSDSITISNVQEDRVYYCYALNDYNEVYTVIFRVKVSDNNRAIDTAVVSKDGAPEISGNIAEVCASVVTSEEVEAGVKVWFEITPLAESDVSNSDRTLAGAILDTIDGKPGIWLDMSMFKQVSGLEKVGIYQTPIGFKFIIKIPEALKKDGRTFYLVRLHNGESAILATTTDNELSGETDLFSIYLIAYKDAVEPTVAPTPTPTATSTNETLSTVALTATPAVKPTATPKPVPKTGDSAPLVLWLGLIVLGMIGIGGALAWKAKKQK